MKTLSTSLATLITLLLGSGALFADTNIAPGIPNGPTGSGLFGFVSPGSLNTTGTVYGHAGDASVLNNNNTTSDNVDSWGQFNGAYGFAGITFSSPVTLQVNSVNFYGSLFGDGGWFGTSGVGPSGAGSTLLASQLIAPQLQVTYNGATWVNVATTNNYVTQMTGVYSNGASPTPETTFTLASGLTGIEGIRLVGEDGGYASGGGGFLGAKEFQVEASAVPEPGAWALMIAGLSFIGFVIHRKSAVR